MSAAGEPPSAAAATVGGQRWRNLLLKHVIVGLMVVRLVVDLLRSAVIRKNLQFVCD